MGRPGKDRSAWTMQELLLSRSAGARAVAGAASARTGTVQNSVDRAGSARGWMSVFAHSRTCAFRSPARQVVRGRRALALGHRFVAESSQVPAPRADRLLHEEFLGRLGQRIARIEKARHHRGRSATVQLARTREDRPPPRRVVPHDPRRRPAAQRWPDVAPRDRGRLVAGLGLGLIACVQHDDGSTGDPVVGNRPVNGIRCGDEGSPSRRSPVGRFLGWVVTSPFDYGSVPYTFPWISAVATVAATLALAWVVVIAPLRRASRLAPGTALRYE